LTNKALVSTGECVDVGHHTSRAMNDSKVVAEQFLSPAANDMNLTVVVEDLFHGAAVADPVKHGAPEVLLVLGDAPTTAGGFANEGVEVSFLFRAFAGIEADGAQASTFESQIEFTNAVVDETFRGSDRSRAVVGLHKNGAKTSGAPVGLQESELGTIVSGEARAGSDAEFHFIKELSEGWCPCVGWNGLAVV
jgi:hypothetical protein